jgi:hypothetical protein
MGGVFTKKLVLWQCRPARPGPIFFGGVLQVAVKLVKSASFDIP